MSSIQHHSLQYLEFAAADLEKTQQLFSSVFDWEFTSYGPDYIAFKEPSESSSVEGGFYRAPLKGEQIQGSVLVVLYSNDLETTQGLVERHGGVISKAIFEFPGGRRFHFTEPSGNELAVWSDK